MGHQKLGTLPRSRHWRDVVGLLTGGADVHAIAAASSIAAEKSMPDVSGDPAVRHSFWLLTQIPQAARDIDYAGALRGLGLSVANDPTLEDVVGAASDAIDREVGEAGSRSDYGELAQLAFTEALYAIASREPDLLENGHERSRVALSRLATPGQFARLAREFFANLTQRHLAYFLSRELTNHTGPGQRFASLRQNADFANALAQHCREASRIIQEFSAEWFSKHIFEGGIDRGKAGRFVHTAAGKIRKELRRRRDDDG